jgi:hypothetical protein
LLKKQLTLFSDFFPFFVTDGIKVLVELIERKQNKLKEKVQEKWPKRRVSQ